MTFLESALPAETKRKLEAVRAEPERLAVHGREIYAWHPEGVARSKLATLLAGKELGVKATARNWTTVTKLLELASSYGRRQPRRAASAPITERLASRLIIVSASTTPSAAIARAAEERRLEALVERRADPETPTRVGARVRDRDEDREPERAADLLRGVDQPAGQARLVVA